MKYKKNLPKQNKKIIQENGEFFSKLESLMGPRLEGEGSKK